MQLRDYNLIDNTPLAAGYGLLSLTPLDGGEPPETAPGQFVNIDTGARGVMLRRPISVCDIDAPRRVMYLLVRRAGAGTSALLDALPGTPLSLVGPLGHGFDMNVAGPVLLVGGGVGVAPLLYYGRLLAERGVEVKFLLGARSRDGLLLLERFAQHGPVATTTEDGSHGLKGMVTDHPWLQNPVGAVACCGPSPMMRAVARRAASAGVPCQVSLENVMACGVGACLCCVEKTVRGNVCVCKEGPVFTTDQLTWA